MTDQQYIDIENLEKMGNEIDLIDMGSRKGRDRLCELLMDFGGHSKRYEYGVCKEVVIDYHKNLIFDVKQKLIKKMQSML